MPTFTTSREATKDEMGREIDRCHKVIAELEAALAERVPDREAVARVINAASRLVSFINEEGPPAREWEAISATTEELAAAIAAMQETKP